MIQPEYRNPRGSNAGDDFHELWVLRQALSLLDHETGLSAIAVEGLRAEDEAGKPKDTWDGVDCTFYYGGDSAATAKTIVIDQVKYSGANPRDTWTVARMTEASNRKKDNSVIGRLAKAFVGAKEVTESSGIGCQIKVRFVSNQPISQDISTMAEPARSQLRDASGLTSDEFDKFAVALDFSETGQDTRITLEQRIHAAISGWTDDDARATVNDLMRRVRQMMYPETKGQLITRETVLLWMGFSDSSGLFPCPAVVSKIGNPVLREVSKRITERLTNGEKLICLHGEAGCGKTTVLQQVGAQLPLGSTVIVFDCYGGGSYLDSNAYRHRPKDAFLQLCNDLATQLRIPFLLSRSDDHDYPRVFMGRLRKASEIVAAASDQALLLIVVDAADNSVAAALKDPDSKGGFVHAFLRLGELPKNVRFIISCRSGRLGSLQLPAAYRQLPMVTFNLQETTQYVKRIWLEAPDAWLQDFHHHSGGNPRVQHYALEYAGAMPNKALDYLRPSGKDLDKIFHEQFDVALRKGGGDHDIRLVCAGLDELPHPIPLRDLSAVTGIELAHARDICIDLAPGIRIANGHISFADEDFEEFVKQEGKDYIQEIRVRVADHFMSQKGSDAYAASHVASSLLAAGRRQDILHLVESELEPAAIGDPVLRREAQLQRLKIAMKVCRETGNNVDAMLTLLRGAEALKTDAALQHMFVENPDLTASFARDTAVRALLRDPQAIESHGPLLFHSLAADARNSDALSVREGRKHLRAWMQRRQQYFNDQENEHPGWHGHGWEIGHLDIAAETEAALRVVGPEAAIGGLLRWKPRWLAYQVATSLAIRFLTMGEKSHIEKCLGEGLVESPWDIFLLTQLALSTGGVDVQLLEKSLKTLYRRRLVPSPLSVEDLLRQSNPQAEYLDIILTACEIVIAYGGDKESVIPILKLLATTDARRRDKHIASRVSTADLTLRAFSLLENLNGREVTLETFWVDPPEPSKELSEDKIHQLRKADEDEKRELRDFIGPVVDIYNVRARALIGSIRPSDIGNMLKGVIGHYHQSDYLFNRRYNASAMASKVAVSITRLMAIRGFDGSTILECAMLFLGSSQHSLGEQKALVFVKLAVDGSLHSTIIEQVNEIAKTISTQRISADEKVNAIVRLSRVLLPISFPDAEALFNQAVGVAGEINLDAMYEIAIFEPLTEQAIDAMLVNAKRDAAIDLAAVVSDVAIRLSHYDHFPWFEVGAAIATLDANIALAAVARWEDSDIVHRVKLLPAVLSAALKHHALSPKQVAALFPLVDEPPTELIQRVIQQASVLLGNIDQKALAEEIARDVVLRADWVDLGSVNAGLNLLRGSEQDGFWMDYLQRTAGFLQTVNLQKADEERDTHPGTSCSEAEREKKKEDILNGVDWSLQPFVSRDEIATVLRFVSERSKQSDTYVADSIVMSRIRDNVGVADRVAHLEALVEMDHSELPDYEICSALGQCIGHWRNTPSVEQWCRQHLLNVIKEHLPLFRAWVSTGGSRLDELLKLTCASDHEIFDALIAAMELHVDSFDSSTIHTLMRLAARYCNPKDAAELVRKYVIRLNLRISTNDREIWVPADIPTKASTGLARFLFAYMSDIDVRTRWCAAHSLRRLGRLGNIEELKELVTVYSKTMELSYRNPDAPFYWLASRLWLVMALDRIAHETPDAVAGQWRQLLAVALDNDFPHVLIRSFAKSAIDALKEAGLVKLDATQRNALKRVNSTLLPRKKRLIRYALGSDRFDAGQSERKFHFDTMDTVPYWYSPAMRCFADIELKDFLDVAEKWINERWKIVGDIWQWDKEPRLNRFSNKHALTDHRHGSRPAIEHFDTYLEWHAMFCAIGELIQTRALIQSDNNSYESYESWLKGNVLRSGPHWLSDYRGPKPIETRFWIKPDGDIKDWVLQANDRDFLVEVGLSDNHEDLTVQGFHHTQSYPFSSTVSVRSALVSPITAASLVKALQTVDYASDYRIPSSGDELEINQPPYKLVGWLDYAEHGSGIDEGDALRHGVREIECCPSAKVVSLLKLQFDHINQPKWYSPRNAAIRIAYHAWGDFDESEGDERYRYSETIGSSGWRLQSSKHALRTFLKRMNLDLILEVQIERRNSSHEYSSDGEKTIMEATFDKIILLRKDGTIETSEGCIGTWTSPRS